MDLSCCPKASKSLVPQIEPYLKSCHYPLINYLGHRAFKCLHSLHYYSWRISKTKIRSCLNNFWTSYFTCILGTVCLPDWKNAQCKLSLRPLKEDLLKRWCFKTYFFSEWKSRQWNSPTEFRKWSIVFCTWCVIRQSSCRLQFWWLPVATT